MRAIDTQTDRPVQARQATFEALDAIQLSEELVDNAIRDACRVVAALWRNSIKLVKEEHAWRRRRRASATQPQC